MKTKQTQSDFKSTYARLKAWRDRLQGKRQKSPNRGGAPFVVKYARKPRKVVTETD